MRPKLVAPLLALGILVLAGGGVLAATRPTWRAAKFGAATPIKRAVVATGATAAAKLAHPAARGVATIRATATPNRAASTSHAHTASGRQASSSGPGHAARAARPSAAKPAVTYTVKSGDTLSGIAEWFKQHGYGSLYTANRSVIGSDPNLIRSGERITISHGVMSLHRQHSAS